MCTIRNMIHTMLSSEFENEIIYFLTVSICLFVYLSGSVCLTVPLSLSFSCLNLSHHSLFLPIPSFVSSNQPLSLSFSIPSCTPSYRIFLLSSLSPAFTFFPITIEPVLTTHFFLFLTIFSVICFTKLLADHILVHAFDNRHWTIWYHWTSDEHWWHLLMQCIKCH